MLVAKITSPRRPLRKAATAPKGRPAKTAPSSSASTAISSSRTPGLLHLTLVHDLPVSRRRKPRRRERAQRSEEHTSELQSHSDLVCRLLLEKKKNQTRRFDSCS